MRLTEPFYRRKVAEAQQILEQRSLDGLLLLNHHQLYYLIGFFHFPSERPIALFVPRQGAPTLFVPKLEAQYAQDTAGWAPEIEVYFEYPGVVHPLDWIGDALVCSGPNSANPHALPTSRHVAPGENIVLRVACFVGGYFAESERTVFLGEPSDEQKRRYEAECRAQEIGTQALQPGARCCDANRLCLDSLRDAGLGEYILHRMGHGVGIQNHEPPWVEDGDETVLQPGMLVSSEPGIYCPGQGGYAISDTVLITTQGPERITHFPRDLESITIPA